MWILPTRNDGLYSIFTFGGGGGWGMGAGFETLICWIYAMDLPNFVFGIHVVPL
jgi:hypothetical protein